MNPSPPRSGVADTVIRIIGIAGLAFLLRLLFVLDFTGQPLFDINVVAGTDMEYLVRLARHVATGDILARGIGSFWWAPLYPYILGGLFALLGPDNLTGAVIGQAALGAITCAMLYLLGRRLFDEPTGLLAGLMATCYGPAIFYTGIALSTTLEVFMTVAILLALTKACSLPTFGRWLIAGIAIGLGCLARPNFLLGFVVLWLLLPCLLRAQGVPADWPRVGRAAVAFVLGSALVILPVTTRNWIVGGKPILISAAGPETFRIANSFDSTPLNFVYPKQSRMPLTSTAFWRHQARKAALFWWGFEPPQNVNYYFARQLSPVLRFPWLPFWVVVPLGALGLWVTRRRWRGLLPMYVFLGAYYISIVAFFIIARWRLPLIIPLLCFSAAGILALVRWIRLKQWGRVGAGLVVVAGLMVATFPGSGPFIFAADYGQLGYILANRGRYAEAAELLQRASFGLPDNGVIRRDLGMLLNLLGRRSEARMALEQAVALVPEDAMAHLALGRLLAEPGGDPEEARQHLTRVLSLAPQGRPAIEARATLDRLDVSGRQH
jgi:4-amino-4-deoxy-L-arabinose transferase-like glycosyltransferase